MTLMQEWNHKYFPHLVPTKGGGTGEDGDGDCDPPGIEDALAEIDEFVEGEEWSED